MKAIPSVLFLTSLNHVAHAFISQTKTRSQWVAPSLFLSANREGKFERTNDVVMDRMDAPVDDEATRKIHRVTWKTADCGDISFEAHDGEILRTAALRRGLVSPHNGRARLINCRGLGTCGTCAVHITSGSIEPSERSYLEQMRLSFPPHSLENENDSLRLACQVQIRGDVEVTKKTGFWGQLDGVADKSSAETYFGELEFVLDNKSSKN